MSHYGSQKVKEKFGHRQHLQIHSFSPSLISYFWNKRLKIHSNTIESNFRYLDGVLQTRNCVVGRFVDAGDASEQLPGIFGRRQSQFSHRCWNRSWPRETRVRTLARIDLCQDERIRILRERSLTEICLFTSLVCQIADRWPLLQCHLGDKNNFKVERKSKNI